MVCYAAWAAGRFDPTQLLDRAVSGPAADPDQDGVANWEAYAFAMDGPSPPILSAIWAGGPTGGMGFAFSRVFQPSDVSFLPSVSTDLVSWAPAPVLESSTTAGSGSGLVQGATGAFVIATTPPCIARLEAARSGKAWTAEIVWQKSDDGSIHYWMMDGTSRVDSVRVVDYIPPEHVPRLGDFNGDGQDDLVFRDASDYGLSFFLMRGTSHEVHSYTGAPPSAAWSMETIGDFDGDGKDDLLWARPSTGQRSLWFMDGASRKSVATVVDSLSAAWSARSGYFDGDSKADLLWHSAESGDVRVWIMDGAAIVTNALLDTLPAVWSIQGTGDFDGDRNDDILLRNSNTHGLVIWFVNGPVLASKESVDDVLISSRRVQKLVDFNGDGRVDILHWNLSSGVPGIWTMDGIKPLASSYYNSVNPGSWSVIP